jgi:hypothetical protein
VNAVDLKEALGQDAQLPPQLAGVHTR